MESLLQSHQVDFVGRLLSWGVFRSILLKASCTPTKPTSSVQSFYLWPTKYHHMKQVLPQRVRISSVVFLSERSSLKRPFCWHFWQLIKGRNEKAKVWPVTLIFYEKSSTMCFESSEQITLGLKNDERGKYIIPPSPVKLVYLLLACLDPNIQHCRSRNQLPR